MHFNLGVDPKQADQTVRSSMVLPAGTGRKLKVAMLGNPTQQAQAKQAGADLVGDDDLITQIAKGKLGFDILIATPEVMPKLSKLAKVLGPKGLMPNPKSGTVTSDVAKAVQDAKAGKVEFRMDKQALIHQAIGKVSFKLSDLEANATALMVALMKAKPASAKGTYLKAATLTSTMGPGIRLDVPDLLARASASVTGSKAKTKPKKKRR